MSSDRASYAARLAAPAPPNLQPPATAAGPLAPTPSTRLRVEAARPNARYPRSEIVFMSNEARKKLAEGDYTELYIDVPGGTPIKLVLPTPDVTVQNLMALSAVLSAQVTAKVPPGHHLGHCALPPGSEEAYRLLFQWNDQVIKKGELIPGLTQSEIPLYKYHHLIDIARALHITPILADIPARYDAMLRIPLSFRTDDVRKIYEEKLPGGHPLRTAIVHGVADVWDQLYESKMIRMYRLCDEFPAFKRDLFVRWGREDELDSE